MKCSNTRVYCDTSSGGGGWTVIQRRIDGSIDFQKRDWVEYEDGFGSLHGEFWIGLRSMHCLTSQGNWELRIDYHLKNGTKSYLHYNKFAVGSAEDQYPLNISGFDSASIGVTDPFNYPYDRNLSSLNGMKFTSRDRYNDLSNRWCARAYGGFWYNRPGINSCGVLEINDRQDDVTILILNNQWHKPTLIEMKVRPIHCDSN